VSIATGYGLDDRRIGVGLLEGKAIEVWWRSFNVSDERTTSILFHVWRKLEDVNNTFL
jgi:hypothetical protein